MSAMMAARKAEAAAEAGADEEARLEGKKGDMEKEGYGDDDDEGDGEGDVHPSNPNSKDYHDWAMYEVLASREEVELSKDERTRLEGLHKAFRYVKARPIGPPPGMKDVGTSTGTDVREVTRRSAGTGTRTGTGTISSGLHDDMSMSDNSMEKPPWDSHMTLYHPEPDTELDTKKSFDSDQHTESRRIAGTGAGIGGEKEGSVTNRHSRWSYFGLEEPVFDDRSSIPTSQRVSPKRYDLLDRVPMNTRQGD